MVKGQGYPKALEPRVLSFIGEHHLLEAGHRVVVAVSGGQDSVCLLRILIELREELKIGLHVAHLDHQLRGAESEADGRYVAHLARQLGIPATIEQRNVRDYQARQRLSLEEAAREIRYDFLAGVAASVGAQRVAVGHTSDDHIETVLLHLIRGTGTRGLRGLQPVSQRQHAGGGVTIIRPLLPVSRVETAAYCRDHNLVPRVDASNRSLSSLRNRIRHQLLPRLRSYNPGISAALRRTARIAAEDLAYLEREAAQLWGKTARRQGDSIIIDKAGFQQLPPALQRYLLRSALEQLRGNLKDIETRHIEEVMAALAKPAGKRLNLPGNLVFVIDYNQYLLGADPTALVPFPLLRNKFVLDIPGETVLPGWRVKAAIIKKEEMVAADSDFTAMVDRGSLGDVVLVRPRQPGDRFQPLGMNQPKKLGEFMIDARIPRAWRPRVPLVCSPQHVIWVVGWRIDDRVKVTASTREVLRLEFQRRADMPDDSP